MNRTLHISKDLSLPLDAVTRRMAILAMSGAGKSNLAVVLAEAMFDAGIPWVAIDPKGDWWGVRSNESGKGPGLPIPIFGGLHGDVPLEPTAGHLIADLIINQRLTCVLDVSEFPDRQGMWLFLHDLGERLLRQNREALHLFLEEADEYIPQRPGEKGNLLKCKGVWQRVVKRGRFRGLGSTQISQRSASLDKDTLYQAEVLFALRAAGKGDKDAIEGWVEYHNAASEIIDSLPTLNDGEGWVSSPAYLKVTERVQFARRRTFDSGATPVLLKGTMRPATLADIDLAAINTKMAATIEKAKAEDPKELKRQIAELKRQIVIKPIAVTAPKTEVKTVEKRIVVEKNITRLEGLLTRVESGIETTRDNLSKFEAESAVIAGMLFDARRINEPQAPAKPIPRPSRTVGPAGGAYAKYIKPKPIATTNGDFRASTSQQRILDALAWAESIGLTEMVKTQLAVMADQSPTSGGYFNNLGALRTAGLLDYPSAGNVALTDAGRTQANSGSAPATNEELHNQICAKLSGSQTNILRELIASYPDAIKKDELAERVGQSPTSGGYFNNLGRLRTLKLIDYPQSGYAAATSILFIE